MKKQFQDLKEMVAASKERLKQMIMNLPSSSDDIKLLSPNCGIISFSAIAKNKGILSPGYYLANETKAKLIKLIDSKQSIDSMMQAVEHILATEGIQGGGRLPPNVLKALKEAWNDNGNKEVPPASTGEAETT